MEDASGQRASGVDGQTVGERCLVLDDGIDAVAIMKVELGRGVHGEVVLILVAKGTEFHFLVNHSGEQRSSEVAQHGDVLCRLHEHRDVQVLEPDVDANRRGGHVGDCWVEAVG